MRVAVTLEIAQETVRRLEEDRGLWNADNVEPNRAALAFDRIRPILESRHQADNSFWRACALAVYDNQYEGLELLADAIERYSAHFDKIYMEHERDIARQMEIVYIGVQINDRQRRIDERIAASETAAVRRADAAAQAAPTPDVAPRRLRLRGINR